MEDREENLGQDAPLPLDYINKMLLHVYHHFVLYSTPEVDSIWAILTYILCMSDFGYILCLALCFVSIF
jgi:hypothetical protein